MNNKKPTKTQEQMIHERALVLADEMLNALLSNSDLNKIVTMDKARGIVYIGGVKADKTRLANLKSEAEYIKNTELWGLLYETPKELAQRAMFVQGESLDDMKKGKSILYTLSTQKNIMDAFLSFNPK